MYKDNPGWTLRAEWNTSSLLISRKVIATIQFQGLVSLDLETWFYLKMLWGPIFLLVREEIMLYNSFLWDNGEVYEVAASPDNYPDPQRFFFLHCFCSLYPSLIQYLSSPFVSRISDGQEFLINSESSCVKSSLT